MRLEDSHQLLAESYERQLRSARARADEREVERLRSEYEAFLEGWRANEELLRSLPPAFEFDPLRRFDEVETRRVREQLAAAEVLKSSSPEERLTRAGALFLVGEQRQALEHLDRLLGLHPDTARLQRQRGSCLLALRSWGLAQSAFEQALLLQPEHPGALRGKGIALRELGHAEEALVHLGRALELAPDQAETHFQTGEALLALDRPREACAAYERALRGAPSEPRYLQRCARTLFECGRLDEALEIYDRALADGSLAHFDPVEPRGAIAAPSPRELGRSRVRTTRPRTPTRRRSHGRRRRLGRPLALVLAGSLAGALLLSLVQWDARHDRHFQHRTQPGLGAPTESSRGNARLPPAPQR